MNVRDFIQNTHELRSFSARLAALYPDATNANEVRDTAFTELQKDGSIPPTAKVGWLQNPGRRKGCTAEENKWLDGLNRIFNWAKYHFGEDGKKSKAADKRNKIPKKPTYFVSYLRVSTKQQGVSGLGLEVQRAANNQYIEEVGGHLLREYLEVASGSKKNRPKVMEAIRHCETTGATLIVARVDRLARNVHFVTGVLEYGFPVIISQDPTATTKQIVDSAVQAQSYFNDVSICTKAALARSPKPKGVKGPQNLSKDPESVVRGRALGAATVKANADQFNQTVMPFIKPHLRAGMSHSQIAEKLNEARVLSARGKQGNWTAQSVRNILVRAATLLLVEAPADTEALVTGIDPPSVEVESCRTPKADTARKRADGINFSKQLEGNMGQIIVEGRAPRQAQAFIDYIASKFPLDCIMKFQFKTVAQLQHQGIKADGFFWATDTGNALIQVASKHNGLQPVVDKIYRTIAHEYYHAIQRLREKRAYRGMEEEMEAHRFGSQQLMSAQEAGIIVT